MIQNNWHYPRPLLAQKYLDLFDMGLTSARGLFARRRMGKTEFLKKDFIPAAEKAGYLVVYTNLWELEIDRVKLQKRGKCDIDHVNLTDLYQFLLKSEKLSIKISR